MDNVSLILTVLNEERSIRQLLESILRQTMRPDEVIIVDAGSTDGTVAAIGDFTRNNPSLTIVTKVVPGNRSVGRNAAIRLARNEIIAATDAGCTLDPNWLQMITKPFSQSPPADVVGGWYQPNVRTPWEHALAMTLNFNVRNVRPESFLPSSRSIAFRKKVWDDVGGYPEHITSTSEDTIFDLRIKAAGVPMVFAPDAVVNWDIDRSLVPFFKRIRQYSSTDGQNRLMLGQYKIVAAFWMIVLALVTVGIVRYPIAYLVAMFVIIGYLFLPLLQSRKIPLLSDIAYVPLMKGAMILATTFGYIQGLLMKKP